MKVLGRGGQINYKRDRLGRFASAPGVHHVLSDDMKSRIAKRSKGIRRHNAAVFRNRDRLAHAGIHLFNKPA